MYAHVLYVRDCVIVCTSESTLYTYALCMHMHVCVHVHVKCNVYFGVYTKWIRSTESIIELNLTSLSAVIVELPLGLMHLTTSTYTCRAAHLA